MLGKFSTHVMGPTQLILPMPSLNLSLRHTALFCVDLLSMEGAKRIGLLLLSSETRGDGMQCMLVARD
jgi:hypothetical protein